MRFADHRLGEIMDASDKQKSKKALVDVLNFDGTIVSHNEFASNQEAADFMVPFVTEHRQFDINYTPIGCRPLCAACAPAPSYNEDSIKLLLDIL
jgi:hypothetical protein